MEKQRATRMEWTPEVGKARHELYRGALGHLKSAIEQGFYIEAVALCESVLSDRLEARNSHLNGHSVDSRKQKAFGTLIKHLINTERASEHPELIQIYRNIDQWRYLRNQSIHNAVKLSDGDAFEVWDDRYAKIGAAATTGYDLVKKVSAAMQKIKARDIRAKSKRMNK